MLVGILWLKGNERTLRSLLVVRARKVSIIFMMGRGIQETAVAGLARLATRPGNVQSVQGIACNRNEPAAKGAHRRSQLFSALLFRVLIVSARKNLACSCVGHAIQVAVRGLFSRGSGSIAHFGLLSIASGPRPGWFPRPRRWASAGVVS